MNPFMDDRAGLPASRRLQSLDASDLVRALLSEAADLPIEAIDDQVDVLQLGLDSLDLTTLLIDLEDRTGVEISIDALERLLGHDTLQVGHLVDALDDLFDEER